MSIKRKNKENKVRLLTLKIKDTERAALQRKANRYTEGNLSEWIRLAASKHSPEGMPMTASYNVDKALSALGF